jgi:hypothetical protein
MGADWPAARLQALKTRKKSNAARRNMGTPVAASLINHSPKQAIFQHIKAAIQI